MLDELIAQIFLRTDTVTLEDKARGEELLFALGANGHCWNSVDVSQDLESCDRHRGKIMPRTDDSDLSFLWAGNLFIVA
jgi:hypothetical protein